jgi:hypothetical protein
MAKLDWDGIVAYAEQIVLSYDTGVTLRQLFYRLVSAQVLPNTTNAYKGLSRYTARARRETGFPDLIDRNRSIHRYGTFESPEEALEYIREVYRRPRDEGQEWTIYVGVEKSGIVEQLMSWFGELGIYVVALGGYSSLRSQRSVTTTTPHPKTRSNRARHPAGLVALQRRER